jgi:3-deoxy-manno-octulosonate cytidylyltransferase (CMP-KDO synthetase)
VVEFAVPAVPGRLPAGLTDASVVAIVPARYASSRLPGKPLADIHGRPMIEHVYRRAARAAVDAVIVATDDERIVTAVEGFGGTACLTRSDHLTGTDRLAELAALLPGDVFVNVQGDEPFIDPAAIDALVAPLVLDRAEQMTTLCRPLTADDDVHSPHLVKVVRDRRGRALYFSRAPIPFGRTAEGANPAVHVGVYAYRRSTLLTLAALPPTPLERRESLEQLRALEHGIPILVLDTTYRSLAVDTPDDLAHARRTPADL